MRLWTGLSGARASRRLVPTLPPRPVPATEPRAAAAAGAAAGGGATPPGEGSAAAAPPRTVGTPAGRLAWWRKGGVAGSGGGSGGCGSVGGGGRRAARASFRVATAVVLTAATVGSVAWLTAGAGGVARPPAHFAALFHGGVRLSEAAHAVVDGRGGGEGTAVSAAAPAPIATAPAATASRRPRPPDAGAVARVPLRGILDRGDGGGRAGGGRTRTGAAAGGGRTVPVSRPKQAPPPPPPPVRPPPSRPVPSAALVRLTVYMHTRVGWERAYIESLFDSPALAVTWVPLTTAQLQGTAGGRPVGWRPPRGATALAVNAMVLKGSTAAQEAAFGRLVRWLSPAVSVFCSDERGQAGWAHATMVAHSTTTLRQYGVYTYANDTAAGGGAARRSGGDGSGSGDGGSGRISHAIPLGYMAGMFDGNYTARRRAHANATVPASRRPYAWAFPSKLLGKDREPMLAAFRSWAGAPHTVGPRSVRATRAAYEAAAFVPNSHGNVVLDCFRLYEASMAGAIPVLVASRDEFRTNFGALPALPPWVVAPDWAAALAAVRALAANRGALDARQRAVSEWWWRVNDAVHRLVEDAVVGRRPAGGRGWGEGAGG